ncbi:MAG: carboxyltransferase domain-containing protein, partial [Tumebacillaceae bacterium]
MFELSPLGDSAIVITLGTAIEEATHHRVTAWADALERHPFAGLVEYIPAFTTVTVFYDPIRVLQKSLTASGGVGERSPYDIVCETLREMASGLQESALREPVTIEIPVCYGGEFGPDLEVVAKQNGLTPQEVIQ